MPITLYHFSERGDIDRFEPRPAPNASSPIQSGAMFWAVEAELEHNYLLPRDCPRVCFTTQTASTRGDIERQIGPTAARFVVAVEAGWLPIIRSTRLYRYELPAETFVPVDKSAAYYISRESVVPRAVMVVDDLLVALVERDVELRITPSLWPLYDAVVASSLRFSCIRMRNARLRKDMYGG